MSAKLKLITLANGRLFFVYELFYNLQAEPFRLSPDHRFCFDHKGFAKARAYMAYAFMRAEGFVMITGRPGTGKTTLIGQLVESLADEKVHTAKLVCTQLQADDLLKMVAYSFGIDSRIVEKGELIQSLTTLLNKWNREGHRALLIVDEAQDLSTSAMEELRLLTNIQIDGAPLLQIFLLGQSELRDLVLSPAMEPVHQRILAASHLESLESGETEAYIRHRLERVGWTGDPQISKSVFPLIYKFSEGVPRRINLICSRLFLLGSVEQRHKIGVREARAVIEELQSENLAAGSSFTEDDFRVDDEYDSTPVQTSIPIEKPEQQETETATTQVKLPDTGVVTAGHSTKGQVASSAPLQDLPESANDQAAAGIAENENPEPAKKPDPPTILPPIANPVVAPVPQAATFSPSPRNKKRSQWPYLIPVFLLVLAVLLAAAQIFRPGLLDKLPHALTQQWRRLQSVTEITRPPVVETSRVAEVSRQKPSSLSIPSAGAGTLEVGVVVDQPESVAVEQPEIEARTPVDSEPADFADNIDVLPGDGIVAAVSEPTTAEVEEQEVEEAEYFRLPDPEVLVDFTFDSAKLSQVSRESLNPVAKFLGQNLGRSASITAYSDSRRAENYNLELSRKRTTSVAHYLIAGGASAGQLAVEVRSVPDEFDDAENNGAETLVDRRHIVSISVSGHNSL